MVALGGSMKSGYLYVLVHPSDPNLFKIGVTVLHPEQRLAQHNSNYKEYAGKIVKETGQQWELKIYIAVPDPYWAESAFWGATHFSVLPGGVTVEIQKMEWKLVQSGLAAAQNAGVRPPPRPKSVTRNHAWLVNQLEGTGITMLGRYRGLITGIEFRCQQDHVFKESPGVVVNRKSCPCCVDWGWLRGPRAGLRESFDKDDDSV